MNIVQSGGRYMVFGESVKTYRELPVGSFDIGFDKMSGFYLKDRHDLTVTEEKVYGSSTAKVDKVMQSYKLMDRNFGVLLSGQKGIGKSLFVRMVADRAIKEHLPVIVVSFACAGLADYISSIEQDCVVIFDEFEKTFAKQEDWNPQDEMLSLFDGIDGGHKLFIVTCNKLEDISQYMLNRPGRFHYHFAMLAPAQNEVREYMTDKVLPQYQSAIDDVVNLSGVIDMPYDFLRAICFELNQGYSLKEAMSDLNITRVNRMKFDIKLYLSNGLCFEAWSERVDLGDHDTHYLRVRRYKEKEGKDDFPTEFTTYFIPALAHMVGDEYIINEKISFPHWDADDFYDLEDERAKEMAQIMNSVKIDRMVLKKVPDYGPARYLI